MDTKEKLEKLTDEDFQMYLGVKRKTFYASLEVLENQSAIEHKHGGKPIKTSVFDRLVITLNYYCEYRTMRRSAIDYGISKSNVCKIIHWTENALVDSGLFALQSKVALGGKELLMLPKQTDYIVGIYLRLSKDDERAEESLSIENQRRVLTNHIREQGWTLYDEYVDDGVSGTTFDKHQNGNKTTCRANLILTSKSVTSP